MKMLILCAGILLVAESGLAQHKSQSNRAKPVKKEQIKNGKSAAKKKNNSKAPVVLKSGTNYAAFAPSTHLRTLKPSLSSSMSKAQGADLSMSNSGIAGLPRRYFGLRNGKIFFKSSDATTSGGTTGSGSVGTGTSLGAAGAGGHAVGINGKSPFAAPDIYGLPGTAKPNPVKDVRKQ